MHAWFTEIVVVKNVCFLIYLSMFVRMHPREQNHPQRTQTKMKSSFEALSREFVGKNTTAKL